MPERGNGLEDGVVGGLEQEECRPDGQTREDVRCVSRKAGPWPRWSGPLVEVEQVGLRGVGHLHDECARDTASASIFATVASLDREYK